MIGGIKGIRDGMATRFARFMRHRDHIHLNLQSPNDGLYYRGQIGGDRDIQFRLIRMDKDEISTEFRKLHKRLTGLRAKSLDELENKAGKVMTSAGYVKIPGAPWDYRFSRDTD